MRSCWRDCPLASAPGPALWPSTEPPPRASWWTAAPSGGGAPAPKEGGRAHCARLWRPPPCTATRPPRWAPPSRPRAPCPQRPRPRPRSPSSPRGTPQGQERGAPGGGGWGGASPPALLHQADWLLLQLHGCLDGQGRTDFNNALKLGYDPAADGYDPWVAAQPFATALPRAVVAPGTPLGTVCASARLEFGLPAGCLVCAGTTDSVAAFLAAGVDDPGGAVTSLGSTLALKLLSTERVEDAASGIYSHKLREGLWLVGGASNVGGAALRQHFTDAEVAELSTRLDPEVDTGLDYYPLPGPGERFPVSDPLKEPRLAPVPEDRARFLQGFLEGIARVEAEGYRKLEALGATGLTHVVTAGGGSVNEAWGRIRARYLGVPVTASRQKEAAYGTALLGLQAARGR